MSIKRWFILFLIAYAIAGGLLYWFGNKEVVTVFFRLLNFAVLIGLAVLLYRRKIGPLLKDMMKQKEQQYHALKMRYDELLLKQNALGVQREEQDELCRYLLGKIDIWKQAFEEQQRQQKEEHECAHKAAQEKARQQAQWLAQNRLCKQVAHQAVDQMQVELEQRFGDPKEQKKYVDEVLTFMKKSIS